MDSKDKIINKKLDLNLLPIFIEIFIHQSITKAGITLGISTTAVSNALAKLKNHFGDPLFLRDGLDLSPTRLAQELFISLQDDVDKLVNNVNSFGQNDYFNKIAIHCSPYISVRLLPKVSSAIWHKNPNCEIIHRSNFSDAKNNIHGVRLRMNDLFFSLKPNSSRSMICIPVLQEPMYLFCTTQHPRMDKLIDGDFSAETFVTFETPDDKFTQQNFEIRQALGENTILLKSDSYFALLSIIENSEKLGVMPKWLYEKFSHSFNVTALDQGNKIPSATIHLIYDKSSSISNIADDIISALS
ncbi:LysR family transcriptional regulator [Hafnia paralvei]|uniref:LysR family transcriptional regulator n=1 Tax=Hafnia paralvei TaxID=546367 RepID=UPI00300D4AF8